MTGYDSYSITPATNATADGGAINYSEGQAPSTVNNSARQALADTRAAFNDLAWFQYSTGDQGAGNIAVPSVYASSTSFTIAGADVTAAYHVGRRLRAVGVSTGTIYGRISITSYSPTTTTVTAVWDSGSLSNETLVISLSQIPVTGSPVGYPQTTWTPTDASGAALSLTVLRAAYIKIGLWYFCDLTVSYPVTADGSNAKIGGLPGIAANVNGVGGTFLIYAGLPSYANGEFIQNTQTFVITNSAGTQVTNSTLSGATIRCQFMLPTV